MALGHFGGVAARPQRRSPAGGVGGGVDASDTDMLQDARDQLKASPEGMAAAPSELFLRSANYGQNMIVGGGFESYGSGTTSAPDGWQTGGAGTLAKNTTNVKEGSASIDLTNTASNAFNIEPENSRDITISATVNSRLRSQYVTFSCWVKASTASRVFLRIDDGVTTTDSPYHTGDGNFQLLVVSKLLGASATKVLPSCNISAGAAITATFDAAVMVEGKSAVAFSNHLHDETIKVSNYQTNTPANATYNTYRMESGIKTASASAGVSITFADAFTTLIGVWVSNDAGLAAFASSSGTSASGFTLHGFDHTGARSADSCYWMALGLV